MGNLSVREIAESIVKTEGGYVNDPDDPGGATNHGVTIGTMRGLGYDVDGNGRVDITDVKLLTREDAINIFIKHYFEKPGIARLPEALQPGVFDMYVNAGSNAVRLLQRMLNTKGHGLAVDGKIGPKTAAAAHKAAEIGDQMIADSYALARRDYYYRIADGRPASRKYATRKNGLKGGWIIRAEEFMSPSLRLTDAEHRARIARWG